MLFLVLGCREAFDLGGIEANSRKLVIDAVVTDTGENGYVRVSYTSPLVPDQGVVYEDENNAIVTISDRDGNDFVFTGKGEGEYINSSFKAEFGKEYQLSVRVGDGLFQSDWARLSVDQGVAPRPSFRADTVEVLSVNGNISHELAVTISDEIAKAGENQYYHWNLEHYYIYDAYGQPGTDLPGSHRFCYIQDLPQTEMLVYQDKGIEGLTGNQYRLDVAGILYGNKMIYDYGIHFIRYQISAEMYTYFENIRKQLENTGGVFDSSPASIQGNIRQVRGNIEVLGFFGVFNETSTHLFFNQDELPFPKRSLPTSPVDCPGHHNVTLENNCFNCASVSARFNSTTKPSWWR
ncbi:MAG: DUF4249 domain-containing protein [Roseivirga sp.]|nr:DUF4249 domain-containing protein [Roseivirga sp.]